MLWIKSDDPLKIILTDKIAAGATVKEGKESSYPPLKKRFSLLLIFKYFTVKSTVCYQQESFIDSKKRNIKKKKKGPKHYLPWWVKLGTLFEWITHQFTKGLVNVCIGGKGSKRLNWLVSCHPFMSKSFSIKPC